MATASSPFNPKLFLTGSADGLIRLYNLQDTEPKATFEPSFGDYVTGLQWSYTRPCVFAAVTSSGSLFIYDLVANKQGPVDTKKYESLEEDGSNVSVTSIFRQASHVCFNPKQRNILGVGYYDGYVRVFKLRATLVRPTDLDGEKRVLNKYTDDSDVLGFEEKKKNY